MSFKPKGRCYLGVLVTIAVVTLHPGVCEVSEQGPNHDMQSVVAAARPKAKRVLLGPRLRPGNSNIQPKFIKSVPHLGETSGMSSSVPVQHKKIPPNNLKTICNKGEVKQIFQGRFDFAGAAGQAHYSSGPANSVAGAEVRVALQPVVECAEASMTLTVRRRWAAQLHIGTGHAFFPLSKLPQQCGYSVHKSWRDVALSVQYNGCHVTQEGGHYVLPLLWRRIPVKISCPVSQIKSQAVNGLSLCCSQFGITIRIQGPSSAKELNVNVRGEWTPVLELVQHCGYSLNQRNAEILIAIPFVACGITSRNGNRALSLQIKEEVFMLTCHILPTEVPQHQSPQPTTWTKPMPQTLKPFQWAPPFYLAPPHYPHPTHHRRTRVHGNTPLTPTTASLKTRQFEMPQDEQNDHIRPPEEYYRKHPAMRETAKVFPHLKHTSVRTHYPTPATGYSPTLMPHNYVFKPYYHYYHHPKIPLTNRPPGFDSAAKSQQPSQATDKTPMFYYNWASDLYNKLPKQSTPLPPNFFFHHLTKSNSGDFHNPWFSTHPSPLPTFPSQIHRWHVGTRGQRFKKVRPVVDDNGDSGLVTPSVKPTHSPTIPHPPKMPIHMYYYYLPYYLYHLYHLYHSQSSPTPTSPPLQQKTPNAIPPGENLQDAFGSYFKLERPVQFQSGNDPAQGLNNKGESAVYSDPSFDSSSWEKWLNAAAKGNYNPEPPYNFPPWIPVPEEYRPAHAGERDGSDARSLAQPFASPCCPGTGSHFHHNVSPGCFTFPVKDCVLGEYFVFALPEFGVEPKVVGPSRSETSCALKRMTPDPHLYFVPLDGCGVTKQNIEELTIYQLELQTCDSDNSLMRFLVECSSYPGFPSAQTLFIPDQLPQQYPVPLQLKIATDESHSYHPEAHLPLSRLRGRLVLMELSLLQPPGPGVSLRLHYCLAYTLAPYASAMLIYDSCLPGSESQLVPSLSPNTQHIIVTRFLSLSSPSSVYDVDPEVYFFCLTEVCSEADGVCSTGCINSSD